MKISKCDLHKFIISKYVYLDINDVRFEPRFKRKQWAVWRSWWFLIILNWSNEEKIKRRCFAYWWETGFRSKNRRVRGVHWLSIAFTSNGKTGKFSLPQRAWILPIRTSYPSKSSCFPKGRSSLSTRRRRRYRRLSAMRIIWWYPFNRSSLSRSFRMKGNPSSCRSRGLRSGRKTGLPKYKPFCPQAAFGSDSWFHPRYSFMKFSTG